MDYLQSMVDFVLHIDVHMTEMVALLWDVDLCDPLRDHLL